MLGKVLLNLTERGVKPLMKKVDGKTVLKYTLGKSKFVQLFDEAGVMTKFKSYGVDFLGEKVITRGTRQINALGEQTTTKVTKNTGFFSFLEPETTVLKIDTAGLDSFRRVTITKHGACGKNVTEVDSMNILGSWEGTIKQNGIVRNFKSKPKSSFGVEYPSLESSTKHFDTGYSGLDTSYLDDMANISANNYAMQEEQRLMEDGLLASFFMM